MSRRPSFGITFSKLEAVQDIQNPNHGIQKIRMKISIASSGWRFYTATALAMLTSRVMAWFFPYPNRAVEDAPFMLKLLEDVDGLCLRIVHSTSSTPDLDISRWDTNGFDLLMKGYSKSFWWFTGIFTSLFSFWS